MNVVNSKSKAKGNLILLLTALIWGIAFVAQSTAADVVETFTYNMSRNVLGALVLLPVIYIRSGHEKGPRRSSNQAALPQTSADNSVYPASSPVIAHAAQGAVTSRPASRLARMLPDRATLTGGICCGAVLTASSGFQQAGIALTTAGKAGFITALYIIMVPLAGRLLGRKVAPVIWLCVALAISGFYLLCVKEGFTISRGDILVLCCAICFTGHILTVDHFSALGTDPVKMSCIQFMTAAVISGVLMLAFEHPTLEAIVAARIPILYAGVLSSGAAYTFQIIGQRYTDPTTATLIMSLESVFAALAGWVILHETLSPRELLGCALVFAAVILAQVPMPSHTTKRKWFK